MSADLSVHSYTDSSRISLSLFSSTVDWLHYISSKTNARKRRKTNAPAYNRRIPFIHTHTNRIESKQQTQNQTMQNVFHSQQQFVFFCWNSSTFFECTVHTVSILTKESLPSFRQIYGKSTGSLCKNNWKFFQSIFHANISIGQKTPTWNALQNRRICAWSNRRRKKTTTFGIFSPNDLPYSHWCYMVIGQFTFSHTYLFKLVTLMLFLIELPISKVNEQKTACLFLSIVESKIQLIEFKPSMKVDRERCV